MNHNISTLRLRTNINNSIEEGFDNNIQYNTTRIKILNRLFRYKFIIILLIFVLFVFTIILALYNNDGSTVVASNTTTTNATSQR